MKRFVLGVAVSVAAAAALATPAAAQCWLPPAYQLTFMRHPSVSAPGGTSANGGSAAAERRLSYGGPEVAGGFNYGFSDPSGQSTFDADVAYGLTDWLRGSVGFGLCDSKVPDAGRSFIFGGAVGAQLVGSADSPLGLVAQLGASRYKIEGESILSVPVIAGVGFALNDQTNVYAGPMLLYERYSFGSGEHTYSDSESRLGAIAGVEVLVHRDWGINASMALLRYTMEEYDFDGGTEEKTDNRMNASLRVVRRIGARR